MKERASSNCEKGWSRPMRRPCGAGVVMVGILLGALAELPVAQTRQMNVPSDVVDQLADSLSIAPAGTVLNLIDEGPYEIDTTMVCTVPVTIQADPGLTTKPKIVMRVTNADIFRPQADLQLVGLEFVGFNSATNDTIGRVARIATPGVDLDFRMKDCLVHDLIDDIIRTDVQVGSIIMDNVFAYNVGDRTMDIRASTVTADTLMVTNSTFFRMFDKFRIDATVNTVIFDAVTIANTLSGTGIELRFPMPDITIRNALIVNCRGGSVSIESGSTARVEYSNFYQDPGRVNLPDLDPADLDTAMGGVSLSYYLAGTGNISRGLDRVLDQGENPVFADTVNRNLAVSIFTQTAVGSSDGAQIGDTRWGTHNATAVGDDGDLSPERFALRQNFPNPLRANRAGFNPTTLIRYELAKPAAVQLSVYNVLGQEMVRLVTGNKAPGIHDITWDGRDATGQIVPSGVYFYRLQAGDFVQTRHMLFLKN